MHVLREFAVESEGQGAKWGDNEAEGEEGRNEASTEGRSVEEVNRLLKQFEDMKKVMGKMAKGGMPRIPGMRVPGGMR